MICFRNSKDFKSFYRDVLETQKTNRWISKERWDGKQCEYFGNGFQGFNYDAGNRFVFNAPRNDYVAVRTANRNKKVIKDIL